MSHLPAGSAVTFGIATAPQQVGYSDILRVWQEADSVPEIEHAWLFDHLLPIGGDPNGPLFEGWTLLSALAAQTQRLRLGLLAHGLPYLPFAEAVGSLAEACTVIRRLWTEPAPFDFDGTYVHLTGAFGNPKPVQRPHPPILIAGRTAATLRVVAEHADVWNIAGGDIGDCIQRSALLDRFSVEMGRDPRAITRSIHLRLVYDRPDATREGIRQAIDAGFTHIVLGVPAPYPERVTHWIANEIINTST